MPTIETVAPEEDVGRDTISRFDMQFQAAAYAALEILEGKGVDCVYCDYHDDFVVRKNIGGHITYHFFQVKTKKKENHQWSLSDIFSLTKNRVTADKERFEKVKASFGGKLLLHGIFFADNCSEVTLLSNVYFEDDVVKTVDELRGKAPQSKAATFLSENFSAIFSLDTITEAEASDILCKMSLQPAVRHIGQDLEAFTSSARTAVFKFSEIDLSFHETNELANGLVSLAYNKSKTPLEGVRPEDISKRTGIQLDDLLGILSISRAAYDALLSGEDEHALKTASVIHRWYKRAGANEQMIDYAAQQKVSWDLWLRTSRHIYVPFDLVNLLQRLDELFAEWELCGADFSTLSALITKFAGDPSTKQFQGLDKDILFGAMNAILVRKYSR